MHCRLSLIHCIQKFKLNGEFISQFGSKVSLLAELHCLCLTRAAIEFKNNQISYCHGREPGSFDTPIDLTLNNSENQLFITDSDNNKVQVFTTKGQFIKVFGNYTGVINGWVKAMNLSRQGKI